MGMKYELRAHVIKALAHPMRLQIIDELLQHDAVCVCEMVAKLGESQSSVSKHLSILREAGFVERRKEGLQVYYSIKAECVGQFIQCIDRLLLLDLEERSLHLVGEGVE